MGRRWRAAQGRYESELDRVREEAARSLYLSRARSRAGGAARRRGDHAGPVLLSPAGQWPAQSLAGLVRTRLREAKRPVADALASHGEGSAAQRGNDEY